MNPEDSFIGSNLSISIAYNHRVPRSTRFPETTADPFGVHRGLVVCTKQIKPARFLDHVNEVTKYQMV